MLIRIDIELTDLDIKSTESITLDLLRISLFVIWQVVFRIDLHAQVITWEGKNTLDPYKSHVNFFQEHVLDDLTVSY